MYNEYTHYYEDFYFSFIQFQYQFYNKALSEPEKIIFKDIGFPQELILSASLTPTIIESVVGMIPPEKFNDEILNKANRFFYDSGNCSFNRLTLPAFENGALKIPKAFVGLNACQEVSNNFLVLSNKYNVPYYPVDLPYSRSEESVNYLAAQYEKIFYELCEISRESHCLENLNRVINLSNQAAEWVRAANLLRRKKPSFLYGGQMLKFMSLIMLFGTQEAVDIAHEYYEFCKKSSESPTVCINEKCRLLWCNMGITYDGSFFEHIEKNLGAIIAFEEINYLPWKEIDTEQPFIGLAKKTLDMNILGDVRKRAKHLVNMVKEYNIDGVVFFSHMNCRMFNPKFKIIKEVLNKESIPIIELTGDCLDKRTYNRAQLLTRVEAFIEMLNNTK